MARAALVLLYQLVNEVVSEIVPFDETQARLAFMAFGRFGKGMGHQAQLNFGDCAVYALAGMRGEPVLATAMISGRRIYLSIKRNRALSGGSARQVELTCLLVTARANLAEDSTSRARSPGAGQGTPLHKN